MPANDDQAQAAAARKPLRDGIDPPANAKERAIHGSAAEIARGGLADVRDRAADAYSTASEKAGEAYAVARDKASEARERAADMADANPLAVVLGGVALGVVIGALLPRTRREADIYGAIGERLAEAARAAMDAARDAGREKLAEMGLSRDNAGASIRTVLEAAINAATDAGSPSSPDTGRRTTSASTEQRAEVPE